MGEPISESYDSLLSRLENLKLDSPDVAEPEVMDLTTGDFHERPADEQTLAPDAIVMDQIAEDGFFLKAWVR